MNQVKQKTNKELKEWKKSSFEISEIETLVTKNYECWTKITIPVHLFCANLLLET